MQAVVRDVSRSAAFLQFRLDSPSHRQPGVL